MPENRLNYNMDQIFTASLIIPASTSQLADPAPRERIDANGGVEGGLHTGLVSTELNNPPKKQRCRKRKHKEVEDTNKEQSSITRNEGANSPIGEQDHDNTTRPSKKSKKVRPVRTNWKASEPVGGLLADLLPVFSLDEEHLLLGYSHSVKVYSTTTSLLVRSCKTGGIRVSSFSLSSQTPTTLYILLQDGKIQWWDWTIGQRLKIWDLGAQVSDITVSTLSSVPETADTLFIAESRKGISEITAHRLLGNEETAAKSLYREKQPIRKIKTVDYGRYIVAVTSNTVIIGTRVNTTATKLKQLHYTFNTFDAPDNITCFDARINSKATSEKSPSTSIDIAIGLENGSIRIYYDAAIDDNKMKVQRTTPKNEKLHWHRQAVNSVAWASDGNYLLSGGSETVLLLWQLDTKSKTTLPHLMSNIEGITVSPKASSYALRLADNSVMILATTDLVPTFNTAGLGFPSSRPYEEMSLGSMLPHRRTPVTCNLTQPPRLISAVPSDIYQHASNGNTQPGSFANTSLQSSPLSNLTMSVSRQALVDNNTTTVRQNPDGKVMVTPNVVLLEVTQSGKWLATIDEWYQPLDDILPNSINEGEARVRQLGSVETNLVFWRWNEEKEIWDKSTRVIDPQSQDHDHTQATSLILDLVTARRRDAFWTLGSDGTIKYWEPHRADRTGSRIAAISSDYVWKCSRSVAVPSTGFSSTSRDALAIPSGRLIISKDESVFAVSSMSSTRSEVTVFTLQPDNTTKPIFTFNLGHLGISVLLLNQYLVMADCESVLVRDLTDSLKWYKTSLGSNAITSDLSTPPHIAADHENQLFAISIPRKNKYEGSNRSRKSRISIFSPLSSSPIATLDNQPLLAALLCVPEQGKFYALTAEAELYSISLSLGENISETPNPALDVSEDDMIELTKQSNLLSNIFGSDPSSKVQAIEENNIMADVTQLRRKKVPWDEIPGLNLSLPFALPKTSAVQMMSTMAVRG